MTLQELYQWHHKGVEYHVPTDVAIVESTPSLLASDAQWIATQVIVAGGDGLSFGIQD